MTSPSPTIANRLEENIASPNTLIRLADALSVSDGGFSVTVRGWRDVRNGYAVSVFPKHEQRLRGVVSGSDLAAYAAKHARMLASPDVVFGGWRNPDDGIAYLDVSIVTSRKGQALELAQRHNQVSVWDFGTCTSVPVITLGRGSRGGGRS